MPKGIGYNLPGDNIETKSVRKASYSGVKHLIQGLKEKVVVPYPVWTSLFVNMVKVLAMLRVSQIKKRKANEQASKK